MKKIPLTLVCMIVISSVLVACLGAYLKYEVLKPLDIFPEENRGCDCLLLDFYPARCGAGGAASAAYGAAGASNASAYRASHGAADRTSHGAACYRGGGELV